MIADLDARKAKVRSQLRACRRSAVERGGEAASRKACDLLVDFLVGHFSAADRGVIALYRAAGSEIDPSFGYEPLRSNGFSLALPVVVAEDQPLRFAAWVPGEPLVKGYKGLEEPAQGPDVVPDAVVIPLLGFDAMGHRLGQGGGFYDRTLAATEPRPLAIGFAWAGQQLDNLPHGPKDERLDAVVTETGVLKVRTFL